MNKAELVDAVAEHVGDRRTASAAVESVLHVIVRTVHDGDKVALSGFGVFEPRARAARTARNPRTGEAVEVAGTTVPTFRPGTTFRAVVSGDRELGALDPAPVAAPAAAVPAGRGAVPAAPADEVPRSAGVPLTVEPGEDREPAATGAAANGARPAEGDQPAKNGRAAKGAKAAKAAKAAKGGGAKSAKTAKGSAKDSGAKGGSKGAKAAEPKGKQKTKGKK